MRQVQVLLDFTPNPNSLKYSVDLILSPQAIFFKSKIQAEKDSLLAVELFLIPGIVSVLIGSNFVTVTKSEEADWDLIHSNSQKTIENYLINEYSIFSRPLSETFIEIEQSRTETENKICHILDNEIRPSVAQDGGDIVFNRFENGILYLDLKGACSGCPSSGMTLKDGIEQRLKSEIPDILDVVST
jgi:Fe-S cluster biogenesis protein NfuA